MFRSEIWHIHRCPDLAAVTAVYLMYASLFFTNQVLQDNSECLWCQITGVRWHKLSEIMTSSGNITIISRNYLHNISCCVMAGSIHWASICLQSSEWISDPEEIYYCVNPLTFLFVSRIPERLTRSIFVRYRSVFTLSLFTRELTGWVESHYDERGNLNAHRSLARAHRRCYPGDGALKTGSRAWEDSEDDGRELPTSVAGSELTSGPRSK